jgi:rfaE bifunctional protein nucleotidyltransferase chain/domain
MIRDKIKTQKELFRAVNEEKASGRKVGFTNGCFDLLHPGHVRYLETAAAACDVLVVAVNSDVSVKSIKGPDRPVNSENKRIEVLAALESVDYVTLFDEDTPVKLIEELTPRMLFKGGDWNEDSIVGAAHVKANGGKVVVVPYEDGHSTTALIEKMRKEKPQGRL